MSNLLDFVRVYNFDMSALCRRVKAISGWEKHSWYNSSDGRVYSEQTEELEVRQLFDLPDIEAACRSFADVSLVRYSQEFRDTESVKTVSKARLNRYHAGTRMRRHVDHIRTLFDGSQRGVPILTVLGAINDDFEGGEFALCGDKFPLAAGDVVIFPSCFLYPHEVLLVQKGTRYSYVAWAW